MESQKSSGNRYSYVDRSIKHFMFTFSLRKRRDLGF